MPIKRNLALTAGILLGFAVLAALFSGLGGQATEGLGLLALGAGVSVFVLWAASVRLPKR
jgi:hypothetical protein